MISYEEIRELKPGDYFYEDCYGRMWQFCCIDSPIELDGQLSWKAINNKGCAVEFLVTKGFEHYGPKLYWEG